jgi:hypothetical protein
VLKSRGLVFPWVERAVLRFCQEERRGPELRLHMITHAHAWMANSGAWKQCLPGHQVLLMWWSHLVSISFWDVPLAELIAERPAFKARPLQ